jgi:hypothetical protein
VNVIVIGARVARMLKMPVLVEALAQHIQDEARRKIIAGKDRAALALALGETVLTNVCQ